MKSNFNAKSGKTTVGVLQTKAPEVYISDEAMIKMKHYIDLNDDEVGWLGTAVKNKDGYYIEDVLLFEQEVHSTTTELTPEGLGEFGEKLLQRDDGVEIWNKIRLWGHSHVNMTVSASGQDDEQMEVFSDNGHDWFIRIIANKKGDMQVDVYDFVTGIIYYNVTFYHLMGKRESEITSEIKKLEEELETLRSTKVDAYEKVIKKEIKQKVSKIVYKSNFKKVDTKKYGMGASHYSSAYGFNGYDEKELYETFELDEILEYLTFGDYEEISQMDDLEDVEDYLEVLFGSYQIDTNDLQPIVDFAKKQIVKGVNKPC